MKTTLAAAPGDVLAVWTGTKIWQEAIRIGEVLEGHSGVASHVIGITHQDKLGRWIGLQGMPGGVGLVDATPYLSDPRTRSNHDQPKPNDRGQLTALLAGSAKSIGVQYDWVGIAEDDLTAIHVPFLAAELDRLYAWPADHGQLPGEVVCSSLWAMLYDLPQVDYAHPDLGHERLCTPADWWDWSDQQQWRFRS